MPDRKSLIVGATGSLGPAVVKALKQKGELVKLFVRSKSKAKKYFDIDEYEIFEGDASKESDLLKAAEDTDYLFYLLNVPYQNWEKEARSLLKTSLSAAEKTNSKFIFPGNVYVYGHPEYNPIDENHPYEAHTKKGKIRIEMERMIEEAGLKNNLNYTIVRMPDFYGPFVINGFYEQLFINAVNGKRIQWFGDLDVPIEFIFIDDAGKAMVSAGLSEKSKNEVYNVPGFSETTARKFLNEIAAQAGSNSKVRTLNLTFIVKLGGLFNPLAKEFAEMLYLKQEKILLDGTKFEKEFGPIPKTPYEEGIAETLNWTKRFYNL